MKNNILKNGKLKIDENKIISLDDKKELSSIVEYVSMMHGYKKFQPYFKQNLDSLFKKNKKADKPEKIMQLMGLEYIRRWERTHNDEKGYFFYSSDLTKSKTAVFISDYKYFIYLNQRNDKNENSQKSEYKIGDTTLIVSFSQKKGTINFKINDSTTIDVDLTAFINEIYEKHYLNDNAIDQNKMIFKTQNKKMGLMLVFTTISGEYLNNKKPVVSIDNFVAYAYLKLL
jgi:hypothetical protein